MLKKISFFGFKSFADREEVIFSDGITGVIGPNGCGKSNIFDGIRWVLGEQSAKSLRGGKMEDVIFSGSALRKERNHAEVSLTLDNSTNAFHIDTPEVTVTRKVFRTGGSEYAINGQVARLKDVQTLFMDSGVGSNSYSMIGQGEIGKILSTNTQERRAIFEEASGIVKLRREKEQTEKHLKEVDADLVRISDITNEIEKQLKPLQNQSKKAIEYKSLETELTSIETQYLIQEYDRIVSVLTESELIVSSLSKEIEQLSSTLAEKESDLLIQKSLFQEKNEQVFEGQKEESVFREEIEKYNGLLALNEERIQNAKHQIIEINGNLQEIEERYSVSTDDFNEKRLRSDSISSLLLTNQTTLESLQTELYALEDEKMLVSNEVEYTRKQSTLEFNELTQKKLEYDQLTEKESEINQTLHSLKSSLKNKTEEKGLLLLQNTENEKRFQQIDHEYQSFRTSLIAKEIQLKELRKTYQSTLSSFQQKETELIRTKGFIENIENFIERNEGFFDGVKAVLGEKKANRIKGIHGVTAELITVKKTYEVAIEGLLQSNTQVILTEDDSVAKTCIQFLKKEKKGRATFKALNMAQRLSFTKDELLKIKQNPFMMLATEAIQYDPLYESAMHSFLGRSLISNDLDSALAFLKTHNIRAKIATIDGEIIQQGLISGGATTKQKINIFIKKRELSEYKESFAHLSSELKDLQVSLEQCKNDINSIESLLSSSESASISLSERHEKQRLILDEGEQMIFKISERFESLFTEEKDQKIRLDEVSDKVVDLSFIVKNKQHHYDELIHSLETNTTKLQTITNSLELLKEQKINLSLERSRLEEEEKQLTSYLEDFHVGNDSIEVKIARFYQRIDEENERIQTLKSNQEELQSTLFTHQEKYESHHLFVEKQREKVQEIQVLVTTIEKMIVSTRTEKEELERKLHSKEVSCSRKETEKVNILTRLDEGYEITELSLLELPRLPLNSDTSKKEIEELKKKMNGLGTINHAAIDDCQALEERFESEMTQLQDIQKAQKDLVFLLGKVEEEMITRFTTTFNDVAEKFSKIFVDLFHGGHAKATLNDPNDPLGSSIDIIAQPPGKKPSSINLLSGGEKAFTAVALIFAIISAKPSPFVYLDEVDAPLDDANVERFATYLKQFSKHTQFIVVTHRKGTKMKCDQIYGVTQEVQGVTIVFPHSIMENETKKIL